MRQYINENTYLSRDEQVFIIIDKFLLVLTGCLYKFSKFTFTLRLCKYVSLG